MGSIRALVVEDSLTVRRHLVEALDADPAIEVVGEAADGKTAIELCQTLRPDVVTLDMVLPAMSGVAVTEYVMAHCPTPILIVSSSLNRGQLYQTYDALAAGAIDVLEKPRGDRSDATWSDGFRARVRTVARVPVITHLRGRRGRRGRPCPEATGQVSTAPLGSDTRLVVIGASTGGPAAVLTLLRGLPRGFPPPILVVIHIGESFGVSLPEWFAEQIGRPVRYALDGEPLPGVGSGGIIMAPPARHLIVEGERLRLWRGPERHSCRPSVDALFESVARDFGAASAACLLTGMGRDGAAGLLAVRRAGGQTIAQDEASCVVFGMPGEAIRIDAARYICPLGGIASLLVRLGQPKARAEEVQ